MSFVSPLIPIAPARAIQQPLHPEFFTSKEACLSGRFPLTSIGLVSILSCAMLATCTLHHCIRMFRAARAVPSAHDDADDTTPTQREEEDSFSISRGGNFFLNFFQGFSFVLKRAAVPLEA